MAGKNSSRSRSLNSTDGRLTRLVNDSDEYIQQEQKLYPPKAAMCTSNMNQEGVDKNRHPQQVSVRCTVVDVNFRWR